jgi:hypothetical protein
MTRVELRPPDYTPCHGTVNDAALLGAAPFPAPSCAARLNTSRAAAVTPVRHPGVDRSGPGGSVSPQWITVMDQDTFNLDLRKFLKRFGVTAQREIEQAVADAIQRGTLAGNETLVVRATLTIPGVLDELRVDGEIGLETATRRDAAE